LIWFLQFARVINYLFAIQAIRQVLVLQAQITSNIFTMTCDIKASPTFFLVLLYF